jgi:hypothetical protein
LTDEKPMILIMVVMDRSIIAIVGLRGIELLPSYRMAIGRWAMPRAANDQ